MIAFLVREKTVSGRASSHYAIIFGESSEEVHAQMAELFCPAHVDVVQLNRGAILFQAVRVAEYAAQFTDFEINPEMASLVINEYSDEWRPVLMNCGAPEPAEVIAFPGGRDD